MLTELLNEYKSRRDAAQERWAQAYNAVTDDVVATDFNGSENLPQLEFDERKAREEMFHCQGAIEALQKVLERQTEAVAS